MIMAAVLLALAILSMPTVSRFHQHRPGSSNVEGQHCESSCGVDALAAAATFDVFAVCLLAGMSVPAAAAAVVSVAPPGLSLVLRRASDLLALGADPETSWAIGDVTDEPSVALSRLARRSALSGATLAQGLTELAEKTRQDAARGASAAAQRAGVLIAGPLGLCFLPAFICVGIVPVVIGLAGEVFSVGPLA